MAGGSRWLRARRADAIRCDAIRARPRAQLFSVPGAARALRRRRARGRGERMQRAAGGSSVSAGSARLCAPGSLGQQAGRPDRRSGRAANGSPRARLRRSVPGASPSWARAPAIITGARSDVSRTRAPPPPPRGVLENCGARTRAHAHAHAHALSLPRPPRAGNVPASPACLPGRTRPGQPGTAVVPTRTRTAAPRPPQCAQQPSTGCWGARSAGKGHGHCVDHLGWALQVAAPTKGCSHLPFLSLEGPGLVPKGPTTPHVRTSGPVRLLQSSLGRKAPEPSCGLPVVFVPHACAGTLSSCPFLPATTIQAIIRPNFTTTLHTWFPLATLPFSLCLCQPGQRDQVGKGQPPPLQDPPG